MNTFEQDLSERLRELRRQGLLRELRRVNSPQSSRINISGRSLINFSSNDYLGLAGHPLLKQAASAAVGQYGAGAGASRLICGNLGVYEELEEVLARFKGTEAALTFTTGYAAALGTIGALMARDDVIILDKLVHASIIDAARLSGAVLRVFRHNDLNHLEHLIKWARAQLAGAGSNPARNGRVLVVTESVFSMDGDHAPLREIVQLKARYDAWLMVDEAHATGLYGVNRRGLAEQEAVGHQIEIQMGTLGKAAGASGGYICGSRILIDYLVNKARSFIFSTAPAPAAAAAAAAGVRLIASAEGEERRNLLWTLVSKVRSNQTFPAPRSAIIPLHIGDEQKAVESSEILRQKGIFIPAIRYPTVARGQARLRMTVTAAHSAEDLKVLAQALGELQLVPC